MSGEKGIEVLHRGNWKKFVPAQDRSSLLFYWHTRFHIGYAHMLKAAEDMNVTWPNISEDIRDTWEIVSVVCPRTIVENLTTGEHLKRLHLRIPLMR